MDGRKTGLSIKLFPFLFPFLIRRPCCCLSVHAIFRLRHEHFLFHFSDFGGPRAALVPLTCLVSPRRAVAASAISLIQLHELGNVVACIAERRGGRRSALVFCVARSPGPRAARQAQVRHVERRSGERAGRCVRLPLLRVGPSFSSFRHICLPRPPPRRPRRHYS